MHKSIRNKAAQPSNTVQRKAISTAETTSTATTPRLTPRLLDQPKSSATVQESSMSYQPLFGLRGGEVDNLASIEAELDVLKEQVIRLQTQRNEGSVADTHEVLLTEDGMSESYADTDSEDTILESAAARLQRIHEQSLRSSPRTASSDAVDEPMFRLESFPLLSSTSTLTRRNAVRSHASPSSYARSLGEGSSKHHSTFTSPTRMLQGNVEMRLPVQKEDHDWVFLQQTPFTSNERPFSTVGSTCSTVTDVGSIARTTLQGCRQGPAEKIGQPPATTRLVRRVDGPSLATEKRVTDRKRRGGLPEAWTQSSEKSPNKATGSSLHHYVESTSTVGRKNAETTKTAIHKTQSVCSGRATIPKARKDPHFPRTPTHQKFQSNLDATTRGSPSKTSSYASPTAASKHRATTIAQPEKPARRQKDTKSISRRTDAVHQKEAGNCGSAFVEISRWSAETAALRDAGLSSTDSQSALGYYDSSGSSSPIRNVGTDVFLDNNVTPGKMLQPTSGNAAPGGQRKPKTNLKIAIPDSSNDFGSMQNRSRIPRPAQVIRAASSSSSQKSPRENTGTIRAKRPTLDLVTQHENIPSAVLYSSQDRADLLEPIKRRLSSLPSQSMLVVDSILSSAELTPVECSPSIPEIKAETPLLKSYQAPEVAASPDVTEAKTCPGHKRAPVISEPCSPMSQPTSSPRFASASDWLLKTIKQTSGEQNKPKALDIETRMAHIFEKPRNSEERTASTKQKAKTSVHDYLHQPAGDSRVLRSPLEERHLADRKRLSTIEEASYNFHSRKPSDILVPQDDPAVLTCGRVKSSILQAPATDQHSSHDSSRVSSLRATAPTFVPVITKNVKVQPRLAPLDTSLPGPDRTSTLDTGVASWFQPEEWYNLSLEERAHIKEKRRARGSSTSSTGLSTFSKSDFSESPEKTSMPLRWTSSARDGAPTKFGRAPLPTMDENEQSRKSKGWGIGSAAPGWWYGWRGGDGREISFVGHGPDAEKNSYAPVNFHNYDQEAGSQGSLLSVQTRRAPDSEDSDAYSGTPTAPKRMREWAARMGYPRVPCGNFEITHTIEHVANYGTRDCVDGWCHECVPAH